MEVRTVDPAEAALCRRLGEVVVQAYIAVPGYVSEPSYELELAAVAERAAMPDTTVLAAVDDRGDGLGCVTYVDSPTSPMAEGLTDGEAAFRMLGVDPAVQGRGAGRALVVACVERARASGRDAVVLHSTTWMTSAHGLYEALGFRRDASLDWAPVPDIPLLGYRLVLRPG